MRIGVVHSFYSSAAPSGENTVVLAQIEALQRAGHKVELFAKHTDIEQDQQLYSIKSVLRAANFSGQDPNRELELFSPDVVHIHNLFPNWSTQWTRRWSSRLVATLHNYRTICASGILWRDGHDCDDCLQSTALAAVRNKCYRGSAIATIPLAFGSRRSGAHAPVLQNARTLITLNTQAQERFQRLVSGPNIELVPNFATSTVHGSSNIGENWVVVGRLTAEKGISWLLDHWPHDRLLEIAGTGPLESDVARAAEAEPNRFRYHGQVDAEHARSIIRSARGLVLPSLWSEGIPTVALEALEAGTPVIVSDRCSAANELTQGGAGRIFTADYDGSSLSSALSDIASGGNAVRSAAGALYSSTFTESAWLARMESIYDQIVRVGPRI